MELLVVEKIISQYKGGGGGGAGQGGPPDSSIVGGGDGIPVDPITWFHDSFISNTHY